MEVQTLKLLSPREFKIRFAPGLSETTIRDLFHATGFPSVQLGRRLYTTEVAATRWLSCCGVEGLMDGEWNSETKQI